jgi:class 3 adenylate cyclase/tetratricopeptide (TPR) repeat protein
VLFADVKGSMELAEQVDPEEWHRILDRFFQILADGVHRFEGTINQYTGDGIMALFGAPIAHEDHAQRACHAALRLRNDLRRFGEEVKRTRGLTLAVRIGLNSGEVVVGKIGDDLRMDYTAQGHTVGLTQRMEQLADPGTVYVAPHTAALVKGYFRLRDLGSFELKGVTQPVCVHELEGLGPLRSRFDVSRARGLSRFVGRESKLEILETALDRSLQGDGQVVGIVGDAGVGKSRLCFEFAQRCRERGLRVLSTAAPSYGKGIPLIIFLSFVRTYFGVEERDNDETARDKIAGRMMRLDPNLAEDVPFMLDFLGVPDPQQRLPTLDPEARQRELLRILLRMRQSRTRRGEFVVFVTEDLHWLDPASETILRAVVDHNAGGPTLQVVNCRPEYHAPWASQSYYEQIALQPLTEESTDELVESLLGPAGQAPGLLELICSRAGGNPFFIEEIVQELVESGHLEGMAGRYRLVRPIAEIRIPGTVQAVLAARVDRLGEREKHVLQAASVVGSRFPVRLLAAIAELPSADLTGALQVLTDGEFIYEASADPEPEYVFKHALTQDVAYQTQLTELRRRRHAALARELCALHADKLDEQAALLAHHWEKADEPLEAARWHSRAAEWAQRSDFAAALQHWRQVSSLLASVAESPETLRLAALARVRFLDLAWREGIGEEETAHAFAEGKALANRLDDRSLLARVYNGYGPVRGFAGDLAEYVRLSSEAVRLADETVDARLRVGLRIGLAYSLFQNGRLSEALRVIDRACQLSMNDPSVGAEVVGFRPYPLFCGMRAGVLAEMGRFEESSQDLERALELGHENLEPEALSWIYAYGAMLAEERGDRQEALASAVRATDLAEKVGSPADRGLAHFILGRARVLNEDWNEATAALNHALSIAREAGTGSLWDPSTLAALARAHLATGEFDRARSAADQAVLLAEQRGAKVWEIEAQLAVAHVLARTERGDAAQAIEQALKRAADRIEETAARAKLPWLHMERAEAARLTGGEAARERELREAHRLFTEMGATGHAERVGRELA